MAAYLLRRFVQAVLILLGVSFITFVLLYVLPADPAQQIAGRAGNQETIENIRRELGLDRPLHEQYVRYLGALIEGDLGRSYQQKAEVTALIWARLPATLLLMVGAIFCELLIGLTMGIVAALNRGRFADQTLMVISFVAVSAPQFVVGILLLYVFAVHLGWFPIGGYGSFSHLVLPALTLGILGAGWYARMMRSSMIDVLRQDYMRTARAKGLKPGIVLAVHALPNAILPIIAMIGIDIGLFMSGIVVVESVFGWPGIGQLAWQAIQQIDIPIIMGVTLVSAFAIIIGNLIADLIAAQNEARLSDLSQRLGVSHATASKVVNRLKEEGYIDTQPYRSIFLTDKGAALAKKCKERHEIVLGFLIRLGVSPETAEFDAEGIEHHISEETLAVFKNFKA